MMDAVGEHAPVLGVAPLCRALGLARATLYRAWRRERFPVEPTPVRALGEAERPSVDDGPWRKVLADFGDVQDIASQMRKEHWPQHAGLRFLAIVISAWVVLVVTGVGPSVYVSVPALFFTLGPTLAVLVLDAFRGSTRWERVNGVGTWGALCGALVAAAKMMSDMDDPGSIGAGMAGSTLCALYAILLYTPRRSLVVAASHSICVTSRVARRTFV